VKQGGSGIFSKENGIEDAGACQAACDADKECKGYEFGSGGCELHHITPTHATQSASCVCYAKELASEATLELPPAPPAAQVPGLMFEYTQLGAGCCRIDDGDIPASTYTVQTSVKSIAACQLLCDASETCTAIEVSPWTGCEMHTIVPNTATVTKNCNCLIKGEAAPAGPLEQPDTAVESPPVANFRSLGSGCCKVGGGGRGGSDPAWVTTKVDTSKFDYDECEALCAATPDCRGFQVKPGFAHSCMLASEAPDYTNSNDSCSACMLKL
jgi:hypothetical protein